MANTGLTEVAATVEEIVSAEIQDVLTASLVVPGTIMDMSASVGPGMDKLKIPRFSNFTVVTKSSGTDLTSATQTFSTDDLDLDLHQAIAFTIEDIAELQSKINVSQEFVNQAGRDLAAKIDDEVINQASDGMALSANISSAAPDHIIAFDSGSTLTKADILSARELLNEANVPMSDRTLLAAPSQESALMAISEFTRVDESGGSQALRNGMIGRLFGFDVVVSSQAPDSDGPLFYHRSTSAFARQQAVRVRSQQEVLKVGEDWVLDHIYGFKNGLDSGKRIVKVNTTGM